MIFVWRVSSDDATCLNRKRSLRKREIISDYTNSQSSKITRFIYKINYDITIEIVVVRAGRLDARVILISFLAHLANNNLNNLN